MSNAKSCLWCEKPLSARGLCKYHYERCRLGHAEFPEVPAREPITRHPLYFRWVNIKSRINNPNVRSFPRYGGRGILLHEAWYDFEVFANDVGLPPFPEAQLDRIDNDGNYEPGNVRWVTAKENAANKTPSKTCPQMHNYDEWGFRDARGRLNCRKCLRQRTAAYKERKKNG